MPPAAMPPPAAAPEPKAMRPSKSLPQVPPAPPLLVLRPPWPPLAAAAPLVLAAVDDVPLLPALAVDDDDEVADAALLSAVYLSEPRALLPVPAFGVGCCRGARSTLWLRLRLCLGLSGFVSPRRRAGIVAMRCKPGCWC